jgi:hypothetical protein
MGAFFLPIAAVRERGRPACLLLGGVFFLLFATILKGQQPQIRSTAPPVEDAATAADQAIAILARAEQAYAGVKDYACTFVKRERLRGQLQPDNVIDMRVRTQPFCVYMRWMSPRDFEGQEACYVSQGNKGTLRAKSAGFSGVVGFMTLDLRDPRVMQNNRHTINEAGIGNLIARLKPRWESARQTGTTKFQLSEYTYNQRPCIRVETTHSRPTGGAYDVNRTVVYFDRENHLPIRVENYDWPRAAVSAGNDLLESYSYANLRLNPGLPDATFRH